MRRPELTAGVHPLRGRGCKWSGVAGLARQPPSTAAGSERAASVSHESKSPRTSTVMRSEVEPGR